MKSLLIGTLAAWGVLAIAAAAGAQVSMQEIPARASLVEPQRLVFRTLPVEKGKQVPRLPLMEHFQFRTDKTPFLKRSEIPIVQFLDGRVTVGCVHQVRRETPSFAVRPAQPAYMQMPGSVVTPMVRKTSSYGMSLTFRFGRRAAVKESNAKELL